MTEVSLDVLGKYHKLTTELSRRLGAPLDPQRVLIGLQEIIEGRFPPEIEPSRWYVKPEHQLEHLKHLNSEHNWGFLDVDFPTKVPMFVPRTPTEVMLLVAFIDPTIVGETRMEETFDTYWSYGISASRLHTKVTDRLYRQASGEMRRALIMKKGSLGTPSDYRAGIRWVGFDPNAYAGFSAATARRMAGKDRQVLAGPEVLMAMTMFPAWYRSWDGGRSPYPLMSGLTFTADSGMHNLVPTVNRIDGDIPELRLGFSEESFTDLHWASPTVREL